MRHFCHCQIAWRPFGLPLENSHGVGQDAVRPAGTEGEDRRGAKVSRPVLTS